MRPSADVAPHSVYRESSVTDAEDQAERKFIERLAQRDERAFNELVELYQARVSVCCFACWAGAMKPKTMAQEVFVQIFRPSPLFAATRSSAPGLSSQCEPVQRTA